MKFEIKQLRPQQEAVAEAPTILQLVQRENGDVVLEASGGTSGSDSFRQSVMMFRNGKFKRHGMWGSLLNILTDGKCEIVEDEPLSFGEQRRESVLKTLACLKHYIGVHYEI